METCKIDGCPHIASNFLGMSYALCLAHYDNFMCTREFRSAADYVEVMNRKPAQPKNPTPKKNAGKPKPRYLDPHFLEAICRAMSWGESKYPANNYISLDSEELYDSMWRHMLEIRKGNKTDSESGLSHKDHFVANVMMWYVTITKT